MDRITTIRLTGIAMFVLTVFGLAAYQPEIAEAVSVTFTNITTGRKLYYSDWNGNFDSVETAVSQLDAADATKHGATAFTSYSTFEAAKFNTYTGQNFTPISIFNTYTGQNFTPIASFNTYTSGINTGKLGVARFTNNSTANDSRINTKHSAAAFTAYSTYEATVDDTKVDKSTFNTYSGVVAYNINLRKHLKYQDNIYSEYSSVNATIPLDNTIPTATEGRVVNTISFTPSMVGSEIQVRIDGTAFMPTINKNVIVGLFVNNTCIGAQTIDSPVANKYMSLNAEGDYTTWSTDVVTVTSRMGSNDGTKFHLNGNASGALFGGKLGVHMMLREDIVE